MASARKYRRYTAEEVLEMVDALDSPSDIKIEERSDDELSVQDSVDLNTTAVHTDDSDDGDDTPAEVPALAPVPAPAPARGHGRGRGRGRGQVVPATAETDAVTEGWQKTEDIAPPSVWPFTLASGPTEMLPATTSPLGFLLQVLGEDFFDSVSAATNLNAVAKSPPAQPDPDMPYATADPHWHTTSADDMRAYVGINIAMGLKVMTEYRDYWSKNPVLGDPYVSSVMPKRRYEKLCQYLHCSLPNEEDGGDKLAKVRPFITRCNERFSQVYSPSQNVSVDEAMIEYNGHLSWKQYIPLTLVKRGIKLWCLCDSANGYCMRFQVYTGAGNNNAQGRDLGYYVVMGLMEMYLNTTRHVFADNYFTSVHLAEALLQENTYLCGTTHSSRKDFLNTLGEKYMLQGESTKWTNEKCL